MVMAVPPLAIIWFADLVFFFPWVLIILASHVIVRLEERGLVETFGQEYERYRQEVPALIPYKGGTGRRFHDDPGDVRDP
jgi:protein-S-isoprenylcysteine O-methyltransferase Ste14